MSFRWMMRVLRLLGGPDDHGTAGWGRPSRKWRGKVRVLTSERRGKRLALAPGSVFIGLEGKKPVILPRIDAARHGLIVGGSGTGKSRGYFLPNAAWGARASLVCTDPKSELWRTTSGFHERATRFAPTEPNQSACFNWIPLCRDAATAELCARALVESGNTQGTEQAWLDMEAAFLAGLFAHAATLPEPTPVTAYRLFTRQAVEPLIEQLLASSSPVAREQAMVFSQTQERMRGSIVPVVAARLQFLRDEGVARFTSASIKPIDFGELRRVPSALYWCLREHDIVRLRPLTSLFFTLLLERLAHGGQNGEGVPVTMLLDEFPNVGTIPGFETTIALARGRGVSLWLGLQSLSQLKGRYGEASAQTIIANCGTKIALSGLDVDSAEYFSRALGEESREVSNTARHGVLNVTYSFSTSEHPRRLLTADEVRRIGEDHAIVIAQNHRPLFLRKLFYAGASRTMETEGLGAVIATDVAPPQKRAPPPVPDLSRRGTQAKSKPRRS